MRVIAVALVFIALLAIPPRPAAAQTRECEFARLMPELVRWLPGVRWVDQRTIEVEGVRVTVQFCAEQSESYRAAYLLKTAEDALRALDRRTNARLTGSTTRQLIFTSKAELDQLGVDGYISSDGVIYLHEDSADSTLVHELAHYWANSKNFAEPWMVEAYAEYLTSLVAPEIGVGYRPFQKQQVCAGVPLVSLERTATSPELFRCAYTAGPRVFMRLGEAVGHGTLSAAISDLSQDSQPISSLLLLNTLERMTGNDLTTIYIEERVLPAQLDEALARRGVMLGDLRKVERDGADLGLAPQAGIAELIYSMRLDEASERLNGLIHLVLAARAREERCLAAGLSCGTSLAALPVDAADWEERTVDIEARTALIDGYERIRALALDLGLAPSALLTAAALGDVPGMLPGPQVAGEVLAAAESTLGAVEMVEAECAAFTSLDCRTLWVEAWDRGELAAVDATLADLSALLREAAALTRHCGTAASACAGFWQADLERSGIEAARATVARLGGLAEAAEGVAARCVSAQAMCRAYWQEALGQSEAELVKALGVVKAMLAESEATVQACAAKEWRCDEGWAAALRDGGVSAARTLLAEQKDQLDTLEGLERQLRAMGGPALLLEPILPGPWQVEGHLGAAKATFARGGSASAAQQLTTAIEQREALNLTVMLLVGLLIVGGVRGAATTRRRQWHGGRKGAGSPGRSGKHESGPQQDSALLARLLAGSPDDPAARP